MGSTVTRASDSSSPRNFTAVNGVYNVSSSFLGGARGFALRPPTPDRGASSAAQKSAPIIASSNIQEINTLRRGALLAPAGCSVPCETNGVRSYMTQTKIPLFWRGACQRVDAAALGTSRNPSPFQLFTKFF